MTSYKRSPSVSYSKSEPQTIIEDDIWDVKKVQEIQEMLAEASQTSGCWGRFFPIPFERASGRSWWDPTFDSEILEEQFRKSTSAHSRFKFRCALWYILLLTFSWFLYFLTSGLLTGTNHWPLLCGVLWLVIVTVAAVFISTYTKLYNNHTLPVSLTFCLLLCILSLSFVILIPVRFDPYKNRTSHVSPIGHFSICIEILLLIYTLIPLRLYMCITIGALYSVAFELLTYFIHDNSYDALTVVVRLLSHVCIHLIGLHILIMINVRMRNTFMKVGQSLVIRQQLESEKKLKENMLHSLMPKRVSDWLMNDDEKFARNGIKQRSKTNTNNDIDCLFRPFNMNHMENVSILFADIVGFTKMSSKKTAEEVVDILNVIFQRFDVLCDVHNCEKISTLGDCYYCVSGCPEPREDHAKCCVEMGLSMVKAIKSFEQERHEGVNIRVGVHTGTVLCGIVGTQRFKFDVWSNDVTLANRMESTGKPGMVHVSEKTLKLISGLYLYEEGEQVFGLKTYFILGKRKNESRASYNSTFSAIDKPRTSSLQVMVSPPTSPPSMSPQTRPRVLSCDTTPCYMKSQSYSPNHLSPDVCKIKASSLPSILDSENEQEIDKDKLSCGDEESVKTPTSTASSGKYSVKLKSFKMPKFLRKNEQSKTDNTENNVQNCDDNTANISGYQQVPTIIETQNANNSDITNGIDEETDSWFDTNHFDDDKQNSLFLDDQKDALDIKSYISQSRSDIGPYEYPSEFSTFLRSGSYRSQCGRSPNDFAFLSRAGSNRSRRGRSPNFDIIVPAERARSATVHSVGGIERHKNSLEVPRLSTADEYLSTAHSVNSRKDSGIKSNSRRSSIQQIENQLPLSDQHRVSGYYTSSQSTINSLQGISRLSGPYYEMSEPQSKKIEGPFLDKLGMCIQTLRKQSDRQLIKCVQDNSTSNRSYFTNPPLCKVSLYFQENEIEQEYRRNVHGISRSTELKPTLANSRYNLYFDVSISAIVFAIVSFCLFILYKPTNVWLCVFGISVVLQSIAFALCSYKFSEMCDRFLRCCQRWYRWNAFGALIVSLPLIAVLANFSYPRIFSTVKMSDYLYSYLLFVSIIHFCNFTQLNCWMKNTLVTILGVAFTFLIIDGYFIREQVLPDVNTTLFENVTTLVNPNSVNYVYDYEILMDLFLMLLLVWLLNREFEIGYRLSFHSDFMAERDRDEIENLKRQADRLIYNIVPEYVADKLKANAKYSENCSNVGIIFASIVNFNEMYDESYLGGKEYLRVLNELIGDFDDLLTYKKYKSVEKIKTIGSTFMAASGLNSKLREEQNDPNEHLFDLMDFAVDMQNVVDNFNLNLLEFNLILRIGYNFGDVTAAVIGNTKLYYDIWGDAVNIASRMDSTGVNGRIQVGEHCLSILEEKYEFEPRGSVYVKGKDNMNLYLMVKRKEM